MFKHIVFFLAVIAASSANAETSGDPAALFGARAGIEHIDFSPDGQRVVYLTPGPGASTMAVVQALGASEAQVVLRADGDPERLIWCNFVTNERLVCRFQVLMRRSNNFIPFVRLIAVNIDGSDPKMLGERESLYDAYLRTYDGTILDWVTSEEGSVLMSRAYVPEAGRMNTRLVRRTEGLGVDRVDVRTTRAASVEPPNAQAAQYITDGRGNVRIMATIPVRGATGMLGSRIEYFYRTGEGGRWQPFGGYDTLSRQGMYPIAVDPNLNAAYVIQALNGRDALYRVKLDGSMATELVYANEEVDVDDVIRAVRGSQVIGVTFTDERRRAVYFDPAYEALARSLARAIPNLPLIDFVESSTDGNRILVHAGSDSDPGRYYVYDRTSRNLNEILLVRPQLENRRLASVRHISYPAADGISIPAYLTIPPGGAERNLPAIILPHGGPESRDDWNFDWLAQYLAQIGYAVLQPNYRGSAGYGQEWLNQNGFRGWRTSIGDITAGARWLASQGIADPNRLAILGWSYGGYAALQAGVTDPDLFKAVVAIAPVTDLQQLKDDRRFFTSGRNFAEYVGSGTHVTEGSPARHASRMTAPVLLFHGERDLNVLIHHSRRMDDALRDAGRRSELVVFPGLEHDLGDGDARRRMLERIRDFLAANVG